MIVTVILLLTTCGIVQSSETHAVAPAGVAPVVTAASSQYFERTFNRLVAVPPLQPVLPLAPAPVAPAAVAPVAPPSILSVLPIAPARPPVVVDATRTTAEPPPLPPPSNPLDPNIAIAIATAQAAPVATILLPPYPFGFPPSFGLLPQPPQAPSDTRESTTSKTTTTIQATTTQKEEDPTTPVPSNIDNAFAQAPSNQDVNFRQYLAPQLPGQGIATQQPALRPQQIPDPNQQFPGPNQQYPGSNQQYPGPNQQFPGPNPQFPGPNQQYPGPNQQFPGPNQQFPGPNQQFPGPNQQFPGPNQQVPGPNQHFPDPNQQLPGPRPQQFPGTNSRPNPIPLPNPQQFPLPNSWPQSIPQHLPLPDARPIKFKTNVEVVPVPLAYIAPPSPHQHHHHNHHHHHHHQSLKVIPHVHTFVPKTSKIIIRPVTALRIRTLRTPVPFATYGPPKLVKRLALNYPRKIRSRDTELTTFKPINRQFTKPQRL
ncbi:uncharacterized protein LOC112044977 [Bicyclus anynana]|uniref:Uncharacterized protein LOC112044977 n=1 Tax=Bicyclus anynana TaxID=110368 RepID=A0A6J1MV79_BICAN|nr:uncharacterized protein LOC112044977 [Bicyclus anynana]